MFYETKFWTWIIPKEPREPKNWAEHGGKWIVFGKKEKFMALAKEIEPYIERGEIESAKYWNWDTSALCVYSLDKDREKVREILLRHGLKPRVWDYDYAHHKNIIRPLNWTVSHFSKLWVLLKSFGIRGTLQFLKGIFTE
jgi:hypothetical protein